jgi:hypothetical protein
MMPQRKKLFPMFVLLLLGPVTWVDAFSLLGPPSTPATTWQVQGIGYQLPGDIGGPVNIGEEYRWNVPSIAYAFDDSFLNYFGQQGVEAVEAALAIINDLGPVSSFSSDLSEFPQNAYLANDLAAFLRVQDLKTTALSHVVELLGLADAHRWIFALRQRTTGQNPARTNYFVIQRNFDAVENTPSVYLNGDQYFYTIQEPLAPPINYADAIEDSVDAVPVEQLSLPISSFAAGLPGRFATGISKDDAGGLRYLYRAMNYNVETTLTNITLATNGAVGNVVSPWVPYFGITNIFTNVFGTTNITGSNVLVATALRSGIETINFTRVNFDSLLGQTIVPVTNIFTDVYVSNNTAVLQRVQRITTSPDLLFTAEDLGVVGGFPVLSGRGVNFINNDQINGQSVLAGPGVLSGPATIAFTTLLPGIFNTTQFDDLSGPFPFGGTQTAIWGSFDQSPESIILYPNNFSIQQLEQLILGQ